MSQNIPTLVKRVKEHPEDSFSKFALALELIKIGKLEQAIVLFESIIKDDPNYVGVYYHLGEQYVLADENKKALDTYKKGIEVADASKDTHAKSELSTALLALEIELDD